MSTKSLRATSVILPELTSALDKLNNAKNDSASTFTTAEQAEKAFAKLRKEYNASAMAEHVGKFNSALSAILSRYAPSKSASTPAEEGALPQLVDDTQEVSLYSVREILPEGATLSEVQAVCRLAAYKAAQPRGISGAEIWLTHDNHGEALPKAVKDAINALGGKGATSQALSKALHDLVYKFSNKELSLSKSAKWYIDLGNTIIKMGKTDCTVRELCNDRTIYRAFTSYIIGAATEKGLTVAVTVKAEEGAEEETVTEAKAEETAEA